MTSSAPFSAPVFGAVLSLVAWRMYRRIRRNIGRQPMRPRRAMASIVIFGGISVVLIAAYLQQPRLLAGFAGGLVSGLLTGYMGLKLTRFEATGQEHFYTPNTHIGIVLSLLLAGRLIYRFMVLRDAVLAPNHPAAMHSPLTLFIFGLLAGYYLVYQTGLLLHHRDRVAGPAPAPAANPGDSARDGS